MDPMVTLMFEMHKNRAIKNGDPNSVGMMWCVSARPVLCIRLFTNSFDQPNAGSERERCCDQDSDFTPTE